MEMMRNRGANTWRKECSGNKVLSIILSISIDFNSFILQLHLCYHPFYRHQRQDDKGQIGVLVHHIRSKSKDLGTRDLYKERKQSMETRNLSYHLTIYYQY